ncbi:hypothetical protein TNCV_319321 [Trichonephila clavipes]|nr:hypothetical protein TNCV_319321 [Trichonephila clavipes]
MDGRRVTKGSPHSFVPLTPPELAPPFQTTAPLQRDDFEPQ